MLDLVLRVVVAVVILYALFWIVWFRLHLEAFKYLLACRDKKWKSLPDPKARIGQSSGKAVRKTVIFVRHGESLWNVTFNGSKLPHLFAIRLIHSALFEIKLLLTGVRDSWFYDSPLSKLGITQALELRNYLREDKLSPTVKVLKGEASTKSCVVVSNLRRAITTALVAFEDRLSSTGDRLIMLPCLQEISINPDAMSITPAGGHPLASTLEAQAVTSDLRNWYSTRINSSENTGNKDPASNGLTRMTQFNEWLFKSPYDTVVVVGHSLWFRSFFREFLPRDSTLDCKTKKLSNGAVVEFQIDRVAVGANEFVHCIAPETVRLVHGAFKSS